MNMQQVQQYSVVLLLLVLVSRVPTFAQSDGVPAVLDISDLGFKVSKSETSKDAQLVAPLIASFGVEAKPSTTDKIIIVTMQGKVPRPCSLSFGPDNFVAVYPASSSSKVETKAAASRVAGMNWQTAVVPGASVRNTLTFGKAGAITIEVGFIVPQDVGAFAVEVITSSGTRNSAGNVDVDGSRRADLRAVPAADVQQLGAKSGTSIPEVKRLIDDYLTIATFVLNRGEFIPVPVDKKLRLQEIALRPAKIHRLDEVGLKPTVDLPSGSFMVRDNDAQLMVVAFGQEWADLIALTFEGRGDLPEMAFRAGGYKVALGADDLTILVTPGTEARIDKQLYVFRDGGWVKR